MLTKQDLDKVCDYLQRHRANLSEFWGTQRTDIPAFYEINKLIKKVIDTIEEMPNAN